MWRSFETQLRDHLIAVENITNLERDLVMLKALSVIKLYTFDRPVKLLLVLPPVMINPVIRILLFWMFLVNINR